MTGIALTLAAVAAPPVAADSAEGGGCPVVAAAQGIQVMAAAEDQVFEDPVGGGVPVAQACVNYALSESKGFASSPYPGDTVRTAPGLVWGPEAENATGQPPPEYPAHAASQHPGEKQSRVDRPGISLRSSSTETSSRAQAQSGFVQDAANMVTTVSTAESVVNPNTSTATALARSDTQPLAFGDVLELGRVRSMASAVVDPKGNVKRESSLTVGRTTVAGQVVQITPRGVEAVGQNAPAPDDNPAEALKAAGVQVRYLTEEKVAGGVLSAGIEVQVARESPLASGRYHRVRYTFGRAFAAGEKVERTQSGGTGGFTGTPGASVGDPVGSGESGSTGPVSGDAPVAAPPAPEGTGALPGPDAERPQVAAPAGMVGVPIDMGMAGFYLVLVCGALAMFVAATLLRLLGVRTRWTS